MRLLAMRLTAGRATAPMPRSHSGADDQPCTGVTPAEFRGAAGRSYSHPPVRRIGEHVFQQPGDCCLQQPLAVTAGEISVVAIRPVAQRHARIASAGSEGPAKLADIEKVITNAAAVDAQESHSAREQHLHLPAQFFERWPFPQVHRTMTGAGAPASEPSAYGSEPVPRTPPEERANTCEVKPWPGVAHAIEHHDAGHVFIGEGREPPEIGSAAHAADRETRSAKLRGEMFERGQRHLAAV